jgi:ketopantoate reductase
MAEVAEYPRILRKILEDHAQIKPAVGEIENELIIDERQGHFELMRTGWLKGNRVHGSVIHVDIRGGKFWIQHDGTEYGIARELLDAGVPKEHIVLAFNPPELRKYTDFAVA